MGGYTEITCPVCGGTALKQNSHFNRSTRIGAPLYCSSDCASTARRKVDTRTDEQKRADKRAYDARRRVEKADIIRRKKAEYHRTHYDPDAARVTRKARMPYHVEYCRKPEQKEKTKQRDTQRRASEYGEFGEAYLVLLELQREIIKQVPDRYERLKMKGYFTKERIRERKTRWQAELRKLCEKTTGRPHQGPIQQS